MKRKRRKKTSYREIKYQVQGHTVVELVFEHGCVIPKPGMLFQKYLTAFQFGERSPQ